MEITFVDSKKLGEERRFCTFYGAKGVFSNEEVEKIKEQGDELTSKKASTFSDQNESVRKGKVAWLDRYLPKNKWVYSKLEPLIKTANEELWKFDLLGFWEDCQYTTYVAPKNKSIGDHYDFHLDFDGGYGVQRKISLVVQLSDEKDYEGGELEIKTTAKAFRADKEKGSVLLFPSYCLHKVYPVTKGKRNSLVLWVSGMPFK